MFICVFIKCRFNFQLFALETSPHSTSSPAPTQGGREKGYFLFLLNKCLTQRIKDLIKIFLQTFFWVGKISKDNSSECKITFHN